MSGTSQDATVDPTVEVPTTGTPSPASPSRDAAAAVGRQLGRYVVVDELGAGGMGRVYRAYDPKLRREVAIKLLNVEGDAVARARMLREAQSMAQLAHPHVVPVYDVDLDADALFIAMEYVDGDTLRQWLAKTGRNWRDSLGVFIEAGEGLVAAHGQGIIHRDFKPANVIVGKDGRTRVMDFGLARAALEPPSDRRTDPNASRDSTGDEATSWDDALTDHGTVMGTPAYMAPEQHQGLAATARSDQYAFCVALWEAAYGRRPFSGKGLESLLEAKRRGPPRPPARSTVPNRVSPILARGLSARPEDRWPDMRALIAALRGLQSGRRRWPSLAGAFAVVAAGGVAWLTGTDAPCSTSARGVSEIWSEQARGALAQGLSRSGVGFGSSTAKRVTATLDDYADALATMYREACEATHVRHEQSDEALDLRMTCLAARRNELDTAVSLLSAADAQAAEHAVELVNGLPPVSSCADMDALRSPVPPPRDPSTARSVEKIRHEIAEAALIRRAGRTGEALERTEALLDRAAELGYEPLSTEAKLAHAQALWDDGNAEDAIEPAREALRSALRLSMTHVAAEAAVSLTGLIDSHRGRVAEARWLATVALALSQNHGADPSLTARAMLQVGNLYAQEDRLRDAEPYFRGAVEHVEKTLGPEHPSLVNLLTSWSSLLEATGRFDDATAVTQRARELAARSFGADHPATASVIRQEAWSLMGRGQFEKAEAAFGEARSILERALGRDHPSTVTLIATMAGAVAEQGRLDEAIEYLHDARRRLGPTIPEDHPIRASLAHNLGTTYTMKGDHAAAIEQYRQAIEIRRRLNMKSVLLAGLAAQARALSALERYDEAQAALEEADAIAVDLHTETGKRSIGPAIELGKLARTRGDLESAREHLETAWVFSATEGTDGMRAETAWLLGQTLWELEVDRGRARELVSRSLEIAEKSEADKDDALAESARRWLALHASQ